MRTFRTLAAAAAGAVLLAGCGAPAPTTQTPPPASEQPPAGSQTPAAPTSPSGAEVSVDDFLKRVSGAEMKTYTMEMEMVTEIEGSEVPIRSTGSFDNTDPETPRSHMKLQVMGMDMELIQVGDDAYLKMAALGKDWMKMDAETAAEMSSAGSPNVGQWTEDYAKNLESVELVGDEQVSGVNTSHYRLTMKPEALDDLGVGESSAAAQVLFDVWIDADGFTRRFVVDLSGEVTGKVDATLNDFNQPVSIEAPKDWVEMPK